MTAKLKSSKLNNLKKSYKKAIGQYLEVFCSKQDLYVEHLVGDGDIICFGCVFFFSFSDIMYDINTNQPAGQIIDWLYMCLDRQDVNINYRSYCMGLRPEMLR